MTADVVVFNVEVPRDELLRRLSGRRWCPTLPGHLPRPQQPAAASTGRCDHDGAALIQREDDKEAAVARRLAEYDERTAPLIDYYRARARFHDVDGYRPVDAVFRRAAAACVEEAARERAEVLGRAAEDAPRLHASWWRRWRRWPRRRWPGVTTRELDRIARERIVQARARGRPSWATAATRPRCASRSTRRSCTASRASASCEDGDIVGLDLGCIVDGFYGDAARTVGVGQVSAGGRSA